MSTLEANTAHIKGGLDDLLEQFKDLPNIEGLLTALLTEFQRIDDEMFKLIASRSIAAATGDALDIIGRILGRERGELSDTVYRAVLFGKVLANLSSGAADELIAIVLAVAGSTHDAEWIDEFPAAATIRTITATLTAGLGVELADLLGLAKVGGVRLLFQYFETAPLFHLDGFGGSTFDGGSFFSTTIEA